MSISSRAYFTPTSISGCALWLDGADQSVTGMTLSGTNVTSWNDKSGNGRHLSASSAYPTITSGGLLFNGATPNVLSNAASFAAANGINSFVVFSSTVAATRQRVFLYFYSGQKIGIATDTTFNSTYSSTIGGDGGVSYSANITYIYGANTYASSPFISHSENTVETQYSPTYSLNASGQTQLLVGGQSTVYFTGTIKEVILYDAFLTIAQRQQVEGYLAQKWALQSILPQGHPGISYPFYRAVKNTFQTQAYSSAFSPKSSAGCALWYDGNDPAGTGLQPSNGATVSTWSDKSGNGNHGTSGTATFQIDSLGGYINFTGSQTYTITNPNIVVNQYFTIFVVEQLQNFSSANNGQYTFVAGTGSSANQNLHLRYGGTGTGGDADGSSARFGFFYNDLNCSTNISAFTTNAAQPTRIWTASFVANSRILYLFSVSTGSDTNNSQVSSWTGAVVGAMTAYGGQYYNGKMRELMIFSGTIGTTQRQTIESYLAQKWGLISQLPASHLHFTQPAGFPAVNSSLIRGITYVGNTNLSGINYFNIGQNYWTSYYQPYLQALTLTNASATSQTIGGGITGSGPGSAGYFGGVLAPNGNIYCIPCNSTSVAVINLSTNALTSPVSGTAPGSVAYYGGVLAPNGMIYCIPANATSIGMINPITNTFSLPVSGSASGGSAYFGGVLAPNGKIYCIPYNATTIGVIDPLTNTFTSFGTAPGGGAYQGGVLAPNGKIYCVPSTATSIGVIDPATNTFSTFGSVPLIGSGTYNGGALGPNGMIYFIPKNSPVIGMVNPTTNTYSTFGTVPSTVEIYYGGILAPNGYIYCLSQNGGVFARIDTRTNTFATISGTVQGGGGYYGGVLAPNGIIYVIPCNATTVATITISGLTQLPSLTYCLSAYTNKF